MLYSLTCNWSDWYLDQKLQFAVQLAGRKVQREGFRGLGSEVESQLTYTDREGRGVSYLPALR
jgi:hypothetical protein